MPDTTATACPPAKPRARAARRCLGAVVGVVFMLLCARLFLLEPFQVPSGSMAPALHGHHRVCVCPECGAHVNVGKHLAERDDKPRQRLYDKTFCPQCGCSPLPVGDLPEKRGDQVLVNRAAYAFRPPNRWEIVLLRLFGSFYIKRVVGLPGEEILVRDGDLIVDGRLQRKTFAQAEALAVPLFDASKKRSNRWRWQVGPGDATRRCWDERMILDGSSTPVTAALERCSAAPGKCELIGDEYSYNGGLHAGAEHLHDFLVEMELEPLAGDGSFAVRLNDGHDLVEAEFPLDLPERVRLSSWPVDQPERVALHALQAPSLALRHHRKASIAMAFVDRRVTLKLNGAEVACFDLPETTNRAGLAQPLQLQVENGKVQVYALRLLRDVHYAQRGSNAVAGESVRLGVDQYFVLGDNSTNSEDSRYWPEHGAVHADQLAGRALWLTGPWRWLR